MQIIGISAYYHDSAAALVVDGEIVAAAQEERFSRKKHDANFPKNAIAYSLKQAGIGLNNVKFKSRFSEFSTIENTDSYSFRNQGRDYTKSNLYFVGDSFTWGFGVNREESFYGIIESEIKQPVIALGVSGYGFAQYEILFQNWVAKYKPKTAALCIFANDLNGLKPPKNLFTAPDGRVPTLSWYKKTFIYQFIIAKKELSLVYKKTKNNLILSGLHDRFTLDKKQPTNVLNINILNYLTYLKSDAHIEIEKSLSRIIDISKKNKIQLFVFMIPSKESAKIQDYTTLFKHSSKVLEVEKGGYERLCQIAHERDINCVNLTKAFRQKSESEKLYFDLDGHWNAAGHKLASQLILDTLKQEGGVDLTADIAPASNQR